MLREKSCILLFCSINHQQALGLNRGQFKPGGCHYYKMPGKDAMETTFKGTPRIRIVCAQETSISESR